MSAAPASMSQSELTLRLQQQELVGGFGLFALGAAIPARLLDEACRVAAEGLQTRYAKVLRYRAETDDLLVVAGVGWHAGVVGHSTLGGGLKSPAGYAVHTGQPTLSNDISQDGRFRMPALLAEHGVQSAINVMVAAPDGAVFGVLEVDSTRRHDFIEADIAFLQSLSAVLAAGLARVAAEEVRDSLSRDKDLLMQEVHHRVTNSLQLVRTMLALQARNASAEVREHLGSAAARIMSVAAVHRRLYEGGSVAEADAAVYLQALLGDLREAMEDVGEGRSIELDAESLPLRADALTPLGLIVSELVTNAIKYGAGRVRVQVRRVAEGLQVLVEDEGGGFGPETPEGGRRGLGMRLIKSLARGDSAKSVQVDRDSPHGRVLVTITHAAA